MPTATRTRTDLGADVRLRVERDGIHELRCGMPLALRRLRDEGDGAVHVGVVQTGAMLVDGDDLHLDVRVGPGARVVVRDISATVAHPMAGGASWRLTVNVAEGARAAILEAPLVVAAGANVVRDVRFALAQDARLLHRETVVLGRHGEVGGRLRARTRVVQGGRPVLDDALDTAVAGSAAVLGDARVVASLTLVGHEDVEPEGFALAAGGRLVRGLGARVGDVADLDAVERRWRAAVLAGG